MYNNKELLTPGGMRFVRLLADFSLLTEIFSNKISN